MTGAERNVAQLLNRACDCAVTDLPYQGQTTNFRTAGGGFAPVYVVGSKEWHKRMEALP